MTVPIRSTEVIEQMLREMKYEFDGFTMNPVSGRCTFRQGTLSVTGQVMETSLPGHELDVRDVENSKLSPDQLARAFARMRSM